MNLSQVKDNCRDLVFMVKAYEFQKGGYSLDKSRNLKFKSRTRFYGVI